MLCGTLHEQNELQLKATEPKPVHQSGLRSISKKQSGLFVAILLGIGSGMCMACRCHGWW